MLKYNTRTIAELDTPQEIILAMINNEEVMQDNDIFLQDSVNNESVTQTDLVITDFSFQNSDTLILTLVDLTNKELTAEIVEVVSTIMEAQDNGFDNLLLYSR